MSFLKKEMSAAAISTTVIEDFLRKDLQRVADKICRQEINEAIGRISKQLVDYTQAQVDNVQISHNESGDIRIIIKPVAEDKP